MKIISPTGKKIKFGNKKVITKNLIKIGAHYYEWVKIGNRRWLTENLYEPLNDFAGTGNARNHDTCWADFALRDNTKKWGILYYTGGIVSNINNCRTQLDAILAGTGFRVPTLNDWNDLLTVTTDMHDLMAVECGGNDRFGFHGLNAGNSARDWNYAIQQEQLTGSLQVVCDNNEYNTFVISHSSSQYWMIPFYNNLVYRDPIRLCADV
jgi:uncharacterized protein (TIGR02145 family)